MTLFPVAGPSSPSAPSGLSDSYAQQGIVPTVILSHARTLHDSLARAGCASQSCSPFQASPDDHGQDCRPWPAGLDWPSIPTQSGEEATSGGQARPGQARQGQQGQVTSRRRCNRSRNRGLDLNGHPRRFIAAERGEQIAKNFRKTRKMTSLATPPPQETKRSASRSSSQRTSGRHGGTD